MPLHIPDPPSGAPDHVRAKLHEFADHSRFSTEALRGAPADQLDVSTPHQVFTLGQDDIAAGGGLERARPVGWRYLIESAGQPIASAETTEAPDGTQVLSNFTEGRFVNATATAVNAAHALPQLAAAGFELRLLRIPALYLMALWLHGPSDLLIPLDPSPIGKVGQIVPPAELFNELARQARAKTPPGHDPSAGPHIP
jgi:hypothetical protein